MSEAAHGVAEAVRVVQVAGVVQDGMEDRHGNRDLPGGLEGVEAEYNGGGRKEHVAEEETEADLGDDGNDPFALAEALGEDTSQEHVAAE